jgi:hypothetical protein
MRFLFLCLVLIVSTFTTTPAAAAGLHPDAAQPRHPLEPVRVGFHAGSWHSNRSACESAGLAECRQYNPGAYVQTAGGWLVGGYQNSVDRSTFYAGRILWHAQRGPLSLDLAGVLATGYPAAKVVPLVTPTLGIRIAPRVALQVGYLPRLGKINETHVLHFGVGVDL